jgi:hypothetical protein
MKKSILLLVLVFTAGLVVGIVGTRIAARHFIQRIMTQPERFQQFMERDLAWNLRLDGDQRAQLHDILTASRTQLREIRKQIQPQTAVVYSNANAQITALLTPAQQARFEQFKAANQFFLRTQRPEPPARLAP